MKPLAIDLYCGLGGWTDGLLAEGYDVVGFDIEQHVYGDHRYPASLVIQDVTTLHGSQFKNAALIVASPPCQAYSYRAMPWKKAKALPPPNNTLFETCFRIQNEASEAAGHRVPMVVENVRGAQKWVGRARWNYGSFYLWGDVPALMPMVAKAVKVSTMGAGWYPPDHPKHVRGLGFNTHAERATKNTGGSWFNIGSPGQKVVNQNPVHALSGIKNKDLDGYERTHPNAFGWKKPRTSSGSKARKARKAASAMIAKIPLGLSRYIASVYRPVTPC